jgi:hypothetical protein
MTFRYQVHAPQWLLFSSSNRSALTCLSIFLIYINNTIDHFGREREREREIQSHDKIVSVLSLAIVGLFDKLQNRTA